MTPTDHRVAAMLDTFRRAPIERNYSDPDLRAALGSSPPLEKMKMTHTPGANWRETGEQDPHGDRYNCERKDLIMGDLTDDQMASAVFMHGDGPFPSIEALMAGTAKPPIHYLEGAKDRIRWLSRKHASNLTLITELVGALERAQEEMRLIRMKDSGAVYDIGIRTEIAALLARAKPQVQP